MMGTRCCLSIVAMWLVLTGPYACRGGGSPEGPVVLENEACRLEFERSRGTLVRLQDRQGPVDLHCPPEVSEGFRLLLPLAEAPENFIEGRDQAVSGIESSPGRVVFHWDGPMSDAGGRRHAISAALEVALEGPAATFRVRVQNRSGHVIQEVWCPGPGGLQGFGPADRRGEVTIQPPPSNRSLRAPFGQLQVNYPGQNMGYLEVENRAIQRSLYLGAHDPVARMKVFHFQEKGPAGQREVVFHLVHFPFIPSGGTFESTPLVARFHGGDWIEAGKTIYRPWFEKTFGLMTPERDWIRRQGFFQMIMVMLPEGNVNYHYREIPQLARDGLKYGLTSLQIAGWQRGGHDNGYPYYEPDPRLGTWDELKEAVGQCRAMGVRVYFFVNVHVDNLDTEWYQRELKDYNFENVKGQRGWAAGWGMGTLASRMTHTTPLMTFADPSFPGLHDKLVAYFKKLAEIGADGIHIDKFYPAALNFNPRITSSPDRSPWEGTLKVVESICRECRAVNPEFRISFETTWDRVLPFGASTWWGGNMARAKRVFPELVETVGLYQPYDFAGLNDAVREGYVVMVAPHHFNRSMDCESWRGLASYIREVKRLRDELADSVFLGEVLDSSSVTLADSKLPRGVEYAAYRGRIQKKRACILTNRDDVAATVTLAGFANDRKGQVRVLRPFHVPAVMDLPARITIEPERLAFVVEP